MPERIADPDPNEGRLPETEGERLDSWKEIAAYLHRDVRTVQRWEKTAGLPVHRHAASRLRTAFAYRTEIEAWWLSRRDDLERGGPPSARIAAPRSQLSGPAIVAAIGLLVAMAGALALDHPAAGRVRQVVPESAPVRVLVTPLVDQIGDGETGVLFDGLVTGELGRHSGIEVAAPRQVARLLRLMRRDAARLTTSLGREVCMRGGTIRFIVAGRVQKLDPHYVVVLEIVDPLDGRVLRSLHREAATSSALLHAVARQARLAASVIVELGRDAGSANSGLEAVTTPSLGAVRLYTAAVQAGARREWAAAELLARRALAADPQFAAASAWVAWAMGQQGRPRKEFLPIASQAVALSHNTSDREAYLIAGMFHALSGDLPKASAAYEALRRLEPADTRVLDLLLDTYARAGQVDPATRLAIATAEQRPNDFATNARAARALAIWRGDPERARPFVQRSTVLVSQDPSDERPLLRAWVRALPVFEHWRAGDVPETMRAIERLEQSLRSSSFQERDAVTTAIGFSQLALGRLKLAERSLRRTAPGSRDLNLAMLALAVGDTALARERLARVPAESRRRPALFASVGLGGEVDRSLEGYLDSEHAAGMTAIARGFAGARRGQDDRAVASLREGIELLRFSGEPEYFLGVEELARILTALGRPGAALRALEDGAAERGRAYGHARWAGAYWLRLSIRLLAAYERLGRQADAEAVRQTLNALLAQADADHPFLPVVAPRAGGRKGH